jgi:hypothetical protein
MNRVSTGGAWNGGFVRWYGMVVPYFFVEVWNSAVRLARQ